MYCNIKKLFITTSQAAVLQHRKNICCNDPKILVQHSKIICCNIKKLIAALEKQQKSIQNSPCPITFELTGGRRE
jgi:hypothetical protein